MITVSPSNIAARFDDITFNCFAENPGSENTFRWQQNNEDIPGQTQPTLQLTSVDATNGGEYTCIISNEIDSGSANVVLNIRPYIVTNPEPQLLRSVPEQASFNCEAAGFPQPTYQWINIDNSDFSRNGQELTFSFVLFSNSGNYCCIASVTIGSDVVIAGSELGELVGK